MGLLRPTGLPRPAGPWTAGREVLEKGGDPPLVAVDGLHSSWQQVLASAANACSNGCPPLPYLRLSPACRPAQRPARSSELTARVCTCCYSSWQRANRCVDMGSRFGSTHAVCKEGYRRGAIAACKGKGVPTPRADDGTLLVPGRAGGGQSRHGKGGWMGKY